VSTPNSDIGRFENWRLHKSCRVYHKAPDKGGGGQRRRRIKEEEDKGGEG
jgi:hypothetical protein